VKVSITGRVALDSRVIREQDNKTNIFRAIISVLSHHTSRMLNL